MNSGTASAAEVLAGALRDNNRALILGERTFGKGLIQTTVPLSDGSAVNVTVAKYQTPSGIDIHKVSGGGGGGESLLAQSLEVSPTASAWRELSPSGGCCCCPPPPLLCVGHGEVGRVQGSVRCLISVLTLWNQPTRPTGGHLPGREASGGGAAALAGKGVPQDRGGGARERCGRDLEGHEGRAGGGGGGGEAREAVLGAGDGSGAEEWGQNVTSVAFPF